jgi:hypothetical protein
MRIGEFLSEEVFASLAIAYHRTRNLKKTNAIGESGFKAGSGKMYGKGIYLTYSFDDQQDDYMMEHYGPFIIRCKINLTDFLIFDADVAIKVYGANASLDAQLASFGISSEMMKGVFYPSGSEYTSYKAKPFAHWFSRNANKLKRRLKGLVFTGENDGRVIVAYDPTSVIPFAWARVINQAKTRETVRWHKITPSIPAVTQTMPEFQRAYRYLRTHGFTLLSHGSHGATLMGVRNGDYLTIVITEQADRTMVKAFCTRIDPFKTKLAGYAEHRGWPLLYKDFTGQLPLSGILQTILTTHDAMKQRPDQHVRFTESLLHHIMKPGVAITRQDKPGSDYRSDEIMLAAGSIKVELDSPYQDFTTGKLWIASKPVPAQLGFNDGSRRGPVSVEGAYQSLLHMVLFLRKGDALTWPDDLQPKFIADLTTELAD